MSLTPFEHFAMRKQAVDALVPGTVGAGPNPGTTGSMDSDPMQASNTDIALMRFQQAAAPILSRPDADGGAGYSHPAPGTSPSLQMFADVKAAAIRKEAREFAEQTYIQVKQASAGSFIGHEAAVKFSQPGMVEGAIGAARGAMSGMGNHLGQALDTVQGGMAHIAEQASMKGQEAQAYMTAGARQLQGSAQEAAAKAQGYVQQGATQNVRRAAAAARRDPVAAIGIGAGALMAAGGAGALADHVMASRQMEAKQASNDVLAEAEAYGREYARQMIRNLR